ncbi:MAG: DUF86 domain-containing protein [Fimbriimonadia bacterium]|nr:DUF86 domain-containing protein [Fimbriimonadia bacterium]
MSSRLDDLYLVDVIEAASAISRMLKDVSFEEFNSNEVLCSAVLYQLVIVGEACVAMSDTTRDSIEDVPFSKVRGFRNRLVHGYFSIDDQIVWSIATQDVPLLSDAVETALQKLFPETFQRLEQERKQR